MATEHPLVETWRIAARLNHYLLQSLPTEALVAVTKGRSVAEQLAHLHNVRLMWLKQAAPELLTGLEKFEKGAELSATALDAALEASTQAIAMLIATGAESGRVKGFKPHATAFVGYLIAHEAHHRGQMALTLRLSGMPLDKSVSFGLWEWGVR